MQQRGHPVPEPQLWGLWHRARMALDEVAFFGAAPAGKGWLVSHLPFDGSNFTFVSCFHIRSSIHFPIFPICLLDRKRKQEKNACSLIFRTIRARPGVEPRRLRRSATSLCHTCRPASDRSHVSFEACSTGPQG